MLGLPAVWASHPDRRALLRDAFAGASDRVVDAVLGLFALFTLCCHATVVCGGNARALWWTASLAFAVVGVVLAVVWRRGRAPIGELAAGSEAARAPSVVMEQQDLLGMALGLAGAGVLWLLWKDVRSGWVIWGGAFVFFLGASVWMLARSSRPLVERGPARGLGAELALWALAVFGGVVTALLHLPNTDDVLYVNIAVASVDHPELRLFAEDTIHGGGGRLLAPYAVHSFELLGGALSRLSGVPALEVLHVVLATGAGVLLPLAWARLFRILDPRRWLWMVAIVVAFHLGDGSDTRSFSMHGFVRLFQGKAILLAVGLPLISAHALAFGRAPSLRAWLRLTASLIAGIGLSSTGLWLAPLVAMTALSCTFVARRSWLTALAWGSSSCAYPLCAALLVRSRMLAGSASGPAASVGATASH
ncbi:MAG: DUF6077 domain-containing protein, partial [Polyangiales bacterium]